MEVSTSLLVALMFITILSIGIAHVLAGLAALVDVRSPMSIERLHTSWMVLLLLVQFNLFWHTTALLAVEDWAFTEFVLIMIGPILAYFASHILVPTPGDTDTGLRSRYLRMSGRFFVVLAALQLWTILADLQLGSGFTAASALNLGLAVLCAALAVSKSVSFHTVVTMATLLVFVAGGVFRARGIID